jgi:hypothetical protein
LIARVFNTVIGIIIVKFILMPLAIPICAHHQSF